MRMLLRLQRPPSSPRVFLLEGTDPAKGCPKALQGRPASIARRELARRDLAPRREHAQLNCLPGPGGPRVSRRAGSLGAQAHRRPGSRGAQAHAARSLTRRAGARSAGAQPQHRAVRLGAGYVVLAGLELRARRARPRPGRSGGGPPSATSRTPRRSRPGVHLAAASLPTAASGTSSGPGARGGRGRTAPRPQRPARASAASATSSRASSRLASRAAPLRLGGWLAAQQQAVVLGHRLVGDAHRLAVHLLGASVTPIWLPSDFDILRAPSVPTRIGIVRIACSGWP